MTVRDRKKPYRKRCFRSARPCPAQKTMKKTNSSLRAKRNGKRRRIRQTEKTDENRTSARQNPGQNGKDTTTAKKKEKGKKREGKTEKEKDGRKERRKEEKDRKRKDDEKKSNRTEERKKEKRKERRKNKKTA